MKVRGKCAKCNAVMLATASDQRTSTTCSSCGSLYDLILAFCSNCGKKRAAFVLRGGTAHHQCRECSKAAAEAAARTASNSIPVDIKAAASSLPWIGGIPPVAFAVIAVVVLGLGWLIIANKIEANRRSGPGFAQNGNRGIPADARVCSICNGERKIPARACFLCNARGELTAPNSSTEKCSLCRGTGTLPEHNCDTCEARGYMKICPPCAGTGKHPTDYQTQDSSGRTVTSNECRTCNGTGLIPYR